MTTATTAAPADGLLTAEAYAALPDDGRRTELVLGKVVEVPPPSLRHGVLCSRVARLVGNYVAVSNLGWVISNAGVATRRDPDTVRVPGVAFFSYDRVPAGRAPVGYSAVPPELVFEVRSPSETWLAVLQKSNEYMAVGVNAVCVLDPDTASIGVYSADQFPRRLTAYEELTLPEVFPDFRVPVREFLG